MAQFQWYRAGNRYFPNSSPWIVDTINNGVQQGDLTPDGLGTAPQRVALSSWNGGPLVPQEAISYRVICNLYRGVVSSQGIVDVNCLIRLPGWEDTSLYPPDAYHPPGLPVTGNSFAKIGTAAISGVTNALQENTLVESVGAPIDIPNLAEGNDWAVFYWLHRGTTPLGAGVSMRLLSFDVPEEYVLPDPWAEQGAQTPPETGPVLLLEFDGNFDDGSPAQHIITPSGGVSLAGGKAMFDGAGSLNFDASDIVLDGDFSISCKVTTTEKSLEGGSQRRLVSLGFGAPAMFIDHNTGAVALVDEAQAVLHTGSIDITTGNETLVEWVRAGGTNTLKVDGQQDGALFSDTRAWACGTATIGRLAINTIGHFDGQLDDVTIVKN